ncbi:hypothetical protein AAFF_G00214940 [Aldrovandia affinis]|uniref:Uncharacterized protein n=1 Tax=Aldrovandia affinis TaxID=143900 RepID=A0AAD7RGU3_9TELE|nr:hypothetical protein AAFF_G00214940 [Aldrovandia affinis]
MDPGVPSYMHFISPLSYLGCSALRVMQSVWCVEDVCCLATWLSKGKNLSNYGGRKHGAGPNHKSVMSESSNITNPNGSGNSWTILTPEAPAAGNVDPGVEGNESLTATQNLAEEVTGSSTEMEAGDGSAYTEGVHSEQGLQDPVVENIGPDAEGNEGFSGTPSLAEEVTESGTEWETGDGAVPTEGVRSEEGLQVCQETVAESNQGSTPPSPTILSPSPSSHISLSSNLEGYTSVNREPDVFSDTYTHIASPESHIHVSPYSESVVSLPNPPSQGPEGIRREEGSELAKKVTEVGKQAVQLVDQLVTDMFLIWGRKLTGRGISDSAHDSELGAEQGTEGHGLRKRKGVSLGPLDQLGREGNEAEEEEQLRPREGEEDGGGITLNKCILGALLLLGMGTILFSGVFTDLDDAEDVDVRELSDTQLPGNQEGMNSDADPLKVDEMTELLDKLAKENQKISELQARLQSQEEELNMALQLAEEKVRESARKGELEKENEKMKEELSSLPALQSELESLRARVAELTLLTAKEESQQPPISPSVSPPSDQSESDTQNLVVEESPGVKEEKVDAGSLQEELERQKVLLEGSRKRLEGMKLTDFEALLGGYLAKLEEAEVGGREEISKLVREFFVDGVFTHDKISFKDFVEDVADILEDMVEGEGEDNDKMEDEMEEFEKEALRKFSVTGGEDKEDIRETGIRSSG